MVFDGSGNCAECRAPRHECCHEVSRFPPSEKERLAWGVKEQARIEAQRATWFLRLPYRPVDEAGFLMESPGVFRKASPDEQLRAAYEAGKNYFASRTVLQKLLIDEGIK